jgi:hypothetical protein
MNVSGVSDDDMPTETATEKGNVMAGLDVPALSN